MIKLQNLPMPPSINNAYFNNPRTGGRCKGRDYLNWEKDLQIWAIKHSRIIQEARQLISLHIGPNRILDVSHDFYFAQTKIIQKADSKKTKDPLQSRKAGEPKRNDTSNRIKIIDDGIAALLQIDDCWFWSGSYQKFPLPVNSDKMDYVDLIIDLKCI